MSSSKNVTFKIENILNPKPLVLLDEERRRSSKMSYSLEITSTKNSNCRRSRPSIFSSEMKIIKEKFDNIRVDAYGNEINKKGNKNFRVSFIDQISSEKIAEVILVESNNNNYVNKEGKDKKEFCRCSTCFIF